MSFQVDIPDAEQAFLNALPLSAEAKARIERFVEEFIANVTEEFRLNPENRTAPDLPYFRVQYLLLDHWGDGHVHSIDFHVRDDKAQFGVLLIVFIDHH